MHTIASTFLSTLLESAESQRIFRENDTIFVPLPGTKKADVKVDKVSNDTLRVKYKSKLSGADSDKSLDVLVPGGFATAKAKFEDGLLEIKVHSEDAKSIEIE